MTKEREALKLALEAFEAKGDAWIVLERKAKVAIKEALAQPEQEPVAWLDPNQTIDSYALSWYQNEIYNVPLFKRKTK